MVKLIQVFFFVLLADFAAFDPYAIQGHANFSLSCFYHFVVVVVVSFGNIFITEMCTHLEWCRFTFMCTCEMQSQRAANTFGRFSYSPSKWHNLIPIKSYLAWRKKITIYIARFGPQLTTILKNNTDESLMSTILFPSDVNVSLFSGSEL